MINSKYSLTENDFERKHCIEQLEFLDIREVNGTSIYKLSLSELKRKLSIFKAINN